MNKLENSPLPEMPAWHARSTYLYAYAIGVWVLQRFGLDPEPALRDLGLPSEVIVTILLEAGPYVALAWAWLERRAPRYKLVWWRS